MNDITRIESTHRLSRLVDGHLAKAGIERDLAGMNEVWDAWVPKYAGPARATGESKLAHPDLLVEILVTAAV
jgi:enamine deaminase RidA (YjgF/YER057c/UK114 family)